MTLLLLGLAFFIGTHSVRIVADGWRSAQIARMGAGPWRATYSLLTFLGLVLIVYGYGEARLTPVVLWNPPLWTRHLAGLLMLPAFILLVAGNLPGTRIKVAVGHPMVLSVKVWAFAHLLANGNLADVILFGSFLVWAIVDFASSRRRDRSAGRSYVAQGFSRDALAVLIGVALWVLFAFWLHGWLFGVRPFG